MLIQYSVLCIACTSSMRLATIVPDEGGTSMVTFECRYPPCGKLRVIARQIAAAARRAVRGGGRSSRGGRIKGVAFDKDGSGDSRRKATLWRGDFGFGRQCGGEGSERWFVKLS
jgi:hypothetical protein